MKNFKRGLRCMVNVVLLVVLGLLVSALLSGCGKGDVDGEKTIRVVSERIKCDYYTPDVCSSNRMTCQRVNNINSARVGNGLEWDCTLVLEEK